MKSFLVDQDGYYGEFGGAYVPEILHKCVEELTNKYLEVIESEEFKKEFEQLLRDYVGRPSPLYLAKRLSEKYGCKLYLKREDLNHTGAHKINNTIGQILLAIHQTAIHNKVHATMTTNFFCHFTIFLQDGMLVFLH